MKNRTLKISGLAASLLMASGLAVAQQPANLAINPATPAMAATAPAAQVAIPVDVKADAAPAAEAPAAKVEAKKESVNPFTGKTYGTEATQREIDQIRLQNNMTEELIKKRKAEIEMFNLDQAAQRLIRGSDQPVGGKTPALIQQPNVMQQGIQPGMMQQGIQPGMMQPLPKVEPVNPKKTVKEMADEERVARENAPKPLEKIHYFKPPADKNIVEPKLIGIVQNDNIKVAILSYNGVSLRVPEGGSVAGKAVTGVGNGKVMWGDKALFSTAYVEGARIERTDYELPGTGQPPQIAQAIKAIKEGEDAKKAYKAGVNISAQSAGSAASSTVPAPAQTYSNASPANRLPPPPPVLK